LSILSDDAIDSFHIQILMKAVISNVPRSIHDTTDYSILEDFAIYIYIYAINFKLVLGMFL
jgi:hypothetical protein